MKRHYVRLVNRGFTLIELTVALAIGLWIVCATLTISVKARDAYAAADMLARLQENGRYALNLVESDVRMAGFWGMHSRADFVAINSSATLPSTCGSSWVTDIAHVAAGQNNNYALVCAAAGGGARPGADVLIVRRASSQRLAPQTATVELDNRDRVLIVSNLLAGEVFVPKDIGGGIPAGFATFDPTNAPALADTRELLVNAYYVSRNSSAGNGYPALRRKRLAAGPSVIDEELLPGVEDLQFQFGVDTNGDGSADLFVDPGLVPDGTAVVSVHLWLRLRTQTADLGFRDGRAYAYADQSWPAAHDPYRRIVVEKTLNLRNAGPW